MNTYAAARLDIIVGVELGATGVSAGAYHSCTSSIKECA